MVHFVGHWHTALKHLRDVSWRIQKSMADYLTMTIQCSKIAKRFKRDSPSSSSVRFTRRQMKWLIVANIPLKIILKLIKIKNKIIRCFHQHLKICGRDRKHWSKLEYKRNEIRKEVYNHYKTQVAVVKEWDLTAYQVVEVMEEEGTLLIQERRSKKSQLRRITQVVMMKMRWKLLITS